MVTRIPSTPNTSATSGNGSGNGTNPRITGAPLPKSNNDDKTNNKTNNVIIVIMIILSGIGTIGIWILYNYLRKQRLMSKVNNMNNNDAVITMFNYYVKVFKKMGYEFKYDETALEFMSRLMNDGIYKNLPIERVFSIFMKARYGNSDVSEQAKRVAVDFYDELIIAAKNNIGTFTFYVYRLLLGQI